MWAQSVQSFRRLLDTNKQKNKVNIYKFALNYCAVDGKQPMKQSDLPLITDSKSNNKIIKYQNSEIYFT